MTRSPLLFIYHQAVYFNLMMITAILKKTRQNVKVFSHTVTQKIHENTSGLERKTTCKRTVFNQRKDKTVQKTTSCFANCILVLDDTETRQVLENRQASVETCTTKDIKTGSILPRCSLVALWRTISLCLLDQSLPRWHFISLLAEPGINSQPEEIAEKTSGNMILTINPHPSLSICLWQLLCLRTQNH